MPICVNCGAKFVGSVLVNGKKRNISNRKNCVTCKPFRHGEVKLLTPRPIYDSCALCKKKVTTRLCVACGVKIRRYLAKQAAIKLLGGKCNSCDWSGNQVGYEFHHLKDKNFNIGSAANKSWEVLKIELAKCVLLCSICHRIEHSTRDNLNFLREVANYKCKKPYI